MAAKEVAKATAALGISRSLLFRLLAKFGKRPQVSSVLCPAFSYLGATGMGKTRIVQKSKNGPCLNIPKALVVYTRGSAFRDDSPIPPSFDHQAPYIDFWLRLIGVQGFCSVEVDNAWNQDRAQSEASLTAAKQSVERMVGGFWD